MSDDHAKNTKQPTNTELFMAGIARQAAAARESMSEFYSFVIREEKSKQLLATSAHQDLYFSFIGHHPKTVNRLPVGTSKTFCSAAYALNLLGEDNTQRGIVVSKTQRQAMKPVAMVADYISEPVLSKRVTIVYPNLMPTQRAKEKWGQTEITVDRPPAIRDPSLMAAGISTQILGARLSFILVDDMVSYENSYTPEAREDVRSRFDGAIMSRLDPHGGRVVVTNTPWNKEDQTYHLENIGWPTMTMDVYGNIRFTNADASWMKMALDRFIRPSTKRVGGRYEWYRLKAHDPDPEEIIPLFPQRLPLDVISEIRTRMLPHEFARSFLCEPMSEEAGRCKKEWIEKCKLKGMGTSLTARYNGANPTYTGLDIGIGQAKKHDKTVAFTIEKEPDGKRRILDIESDRLKGPDIVQLVIDKYHNYKSAIQVEGNHAQTWIKDFAKKENKIIPVRAITTTSVNKHHKEFGVESIFQELMEGMWIIPCDDDGNCSKEVQGLIDDLMYYDPSTHTADRIMAMWMAREASRSKHGNDPKPRAGLRRDMPGAAGF